MSERFYEILVASRVHVSAVAKNFSWLTSHFDAGYVFVNFLLAFVIEHKYKQWEDNM